MAVSLGWRVFEALEFLIALFHTKRLVCNKWCVSYAFKKKLSRKKVEVGESMNYSNKRCVEAEEEDDYQTI